MDHKEVIIKALKMPESEGEIFDRVKKVLTRSGLSTSKLNWFLLGRELGKIKIKPPHSV